MADDKSFDTRSREAREARDARDAREPVAAKKDEKVEGEPREGEPGTVDGAGVQVPPVDQPEPMHAAVNPVPVDEEDDDVGNGTKYHGVTDEFKRGTPSGA